MAQIIRIKRRIGTAGAPPSLTAGEIAYNRTAAAHATNPGPDDLYVGDGVGVHPLVSSSRQVELTGNQTITGEKTFSVGAAGSLHVTGGTNGQMITTNGAGVLAFTTVPGGAGTVAVEANDPITGDGTTGDPLEVTMATNAQIITGTDTTFPIDSAGLRSQLGAAANATNLGTTASTVVPAIHELAGKITTLVGAIIVVGQYQATAHTVTGVRPPAAPGLADGAALPAAADSNRGWLFVVSQAGTAIAPAPVVSMAVGDWVVSNGTDWVHLSMGLTSIAAGNVSITTLDSQPWINVQTALQGIFTLVNTKLTTVEVDDVSITGTGVVGDELEVALVDAGTY